MKPAERYLDSAEVRARFDISKPTLYRWMADPEIGFPKPVRIKTRYYFSETAIEAWEEARGKVQRQEPETVAGCPVVSGVISSYADLVEAMTARRNELGISCLEVDMRSGMHDGYTNKLENWRKPYGRGMGAEIFPLWLGGLRVGVVLVDLPRRPRRSGKKLDPAAAA